MSEIFIINEWLWSDLIGENSEQKQKEAYDFLLTLYEKCDRIAVAKDSEFQRKEWSFSKKAVNEMERKIARIYFYNIRFNSKKYEEVNIKLGKGFDLADINPDDHYLVKTYYKTNATIITSDNDLVKILESKGIPCKLRDEFLQEYK